MYSRAEIHVAVTATGLQNNVIFCKFIGKITQIYPNALYSSEARTIITDLIYDSHESDSILSSLLILYNELVQARSKTTFGLVYDSFYNTSLLEDIKPICLHHRDVIPEHTEDNREINIIIELISLLNVYYYPGGLDDRPVV